MNDLGVKDPKTWPPGALIAYDESRFRNPSMLDCHYGLGLVVANDGTFVCVVWDAGCKKPFTTYEVNRLNPDVIERVG